MKQLKKIQFNNNKMRIQLMNFVIVKNVHVKKKKEMNEKNRMIIIR